MSMPAAAPSQVTETLPVPATNAILHDALFIVTRHKAVDVESYRTPIPKYVKTAVWQYVPRKWELEGTYYTTNEVFVFLPDRAHPLHVPDVPFFEQYKAERAADIEREFAELIARLRADPMVESVTPGVFAKKPEVEVSIPRELFHAFAGNNHTDALMQL